MAWRRVFDAVLLTSTLGECQPRRRGDSGATAVWMLLLLSCAACGAVQALVAAKLFAGLEASYFVAVSVPVLVWVPCAACALIAIARA